MPTKFAAVCLLAAALCACSEKPDQTLVQSERTAATYNDGSLR